MTLRTRLFILPLTVSLFLATAAACGSDDPDPATTPTGTVTSSPTATTTEGPPATATTPATSPTSGATSPATPAPAPAPTGAVDAVLRYYQAITDARYEDAYALWVRNPQSLEEFRAGFANTVETRALVRAASGNGGSAEVEVTVRAVVNEATGAQALQHFAISYAMERGAEGWRIGSADAREEAPPPELPAELADPAALVEAYTDAINRGELGRAYTAWADTGRASMQTFEAFVQGFAATGTVTVTTGEPALDAGAGSRFASVPAVLVSKQTDGSTRGYCGRYELRRPNLPPFDGLGWAIGRADIAELPETPAASDIPGLLANDCRAP